MEKLFSLPEGLHCIRLKSDDKTFDEKNEELTQRSQSFTEMSSLWLSVLLRGSLCNKNFIYFSFYRSILFPVLFHLLLLPIIYLLRKAYQIFLPYHSD